MVVAFKFLARDALGYGKGDGVLMACACAWGGGAVAGVGYVGLVVRGDRRGGL